LWNNRTNPRVYNAFVDVFDLMGHAEPDRLWVSIDQCGLKLPYNEKKREYHHPGFTHWDMDITASRPLPIHVQGVIALSDTDKDMGGFHCLAGMHQYLDQWMTDHKIAESIPKQALKKFYADAFPIVVPPHEKTLKGKKHVVVEMNQGDLVIWRGELAHGNGVNRGTRPRYAQYVTMFPALGVDATTYGAATGHRINVWKNRLTGGMIPYPQISKDGICLVPGPDDDRRQKEKKELPASELSELGRKLLGLDAW